MANAELAKRWPSYTWAFNIPEIKEILEDSTLTDGAELQARIQNTPWWKNNSPAIRNWIARKETDPAGANQDREQKEADIWDMYLAVGLKPDQGAVQELANSALNLGWTSNQLRDAIVGHMSYSPDITKQIGTVQTMMSQFKEQAKQMYVNLDDKTAFDWAKSVAAGEHSAEDFMPIVQGWGKSRFSYSPEVQNAIDMGMTVEQYFAPTKQQIGQILERDPNSIDLANDPKWSQVLDTVDEKGARRAMTLSETQVFARSQDEFKGTRQGQEVAATATEGLLKMFGKVAS